MSIRTQFSTRRLALFVAALLCLATFQSDALAHCGCNSSREIHPPGIPKCDGHCKPAPKVNCFKKAMDGLKMGIDRLFHRCKGGCDDVLCDDACDAAMIEELMMPPQLTPHVHSHGDPNPPAVEGTLPRPIEEVQPMTPPVRLQEPPANPDGGSLFDTLDDPFTDDEARAQTYRPVRPSAYNQVELRPIQLQPIRVTPVPRQSSRRATNSR